MILIKYFYNLAIPGCLLLAGCASHDATRVEEDFGNSVRNMINEQIYDPKAAKYPAYDPPLSLDGSYAEEVLNAYRNDVPTPEDVRRPISIEITE